MGHTDNFSSPLTLPALHAILLWGNESISPGIHLRALWMLHATLASELDIHTQPLSISMDVRALNGRSIGWVTHKTIPINLRVSGNHSETIQFLLVKSPQSGSHGIGILLGPATQSPH